MIEMIFVMAIIVVALGYMINRWRKVARRQAGCGCGCNGCARADKGKCH